VNITNDNFYIKKACAEDIPLLLDFIKGIAIYEKLLDEVTATEETLYNSLFSQNSNAEAVIAYYNDMPVGYAVYFYNFSTFLGKKGLYMEDLYIKPEFRKMGIGKRIFIYLVNIAIERDCGRMEWAALNWNSSAIDFYKKLGAEPLDEWIVFRLTRDKLDKLKDSF
jgi:GNAT superfamily N-acetyltransferase